MTHLVIVGGSDADVFAALRARELDPVTDIAVVVADALPNYSICGIPLLLHRRDDSVAGAGTPHRRRSRGHRLSLSSAPSDRAQLRMIHRLGAHSCDALRSAAENLGHGDRGGLLALQI